MDAPDADPDQLRKSLAFIRRINSLLGYTRATLWHLERFCESWKPGEPIRILDVATGSADIPKAILRWADRRGWDVHIVALDLHLDTTREVEAPDPRLRLIRADALALPFAEDTFDYALTHMFLHHLDEHQAVTVLREMARVSRRGILAADLIRGRRPYAWISLFTLLANPMVKHDAKVSVAQAFTRGEILDLRDRAGISFTDYYRHFAHRFVLAGEKPSGTAGRAPRAG